MHGSWHAVNTRVSVLHGTQTPQQHVTSELQHGACVYRELLTSSRGRAAHLRSRCRFGAPEAAAARSHVRTQAPEGRQAPRTARQSVRTPCGRRAGQTPPAFSAARQPLRQFPVDGTVQSDVIVGFTAAPVVSFIRISVSVDVSPPLGVI